MLGKLLRLLREVGRCAEIGRKIAQIPREVHAVRDREPVLQAFFCSGHLGFLRYREDELPQRALGRVLRALQAIKAVHRVERDERGL